MQMEQERAEARREEQRNSVGMPFRFFTPQGETREIVVVDHEPTFFRHEHNLQDSRTKRWDVFLPCIDEVCVCPACSVSDRPAYFAMFLTIIDLTPYADKDGNEVPFSKKLLVVKLTQQKKIMRYFERHGSLRGMILSMTRDSKKDANIGDPEFVEFMSEDDLLTYQSSYVDKENVEHLVDCSEPFNYEELFPPMDEDQLRALVGGERPAGSRAADDRALGRGRSAPAHDDEDGWQGQGRRVASRRTPADDAEPEYTDYQEEPAPAPARRAAPVRPLPAPATPARRAAPAAAAPPARGPARRPAPAIDPDDLPDAGGENDPPFDVDPPQRTARTAPAPRTAPRAAPAPARRPAPEPQQAAPRAAVAARRQALRR